MFKILQEGEEQESFETMEEVVEWLTAYRKDFINDELTEKQNFPSLYPVDYDPADSVDEYMRDVFELYQTVAWPVLA